MESRWSFLLTFLLCLIPLRPAVASSFTDPRSDHDAAIDAATATEPRDPACYSATLVSTGGAAPRNPRTLSVRWTGVSNFELAYKGHIILLDAFFDRPATFRPLGFKAADVKRADVILLGHGHFDHMSDAASVGSRTGATIVGAPVTTEKLLTQSIDAKQVKTVNGRGGELLDFKDFTVEPILALHGQPSKEITATMEHAVNSLSPQPTPEQIAEEKIIEARGTADPRVITEGTIAYLITLDDGFRIMYRDSGGKITDYEKSAMARIGRVDLALAATSADYLAPLMTEQALEYLHVYKPDVFVPAHHDAPTSGHVPLWRASEPLFQALKDEDPNLVTVSREYREPICFNTEFNAQKKQSSGSEPVNGR
jgi:L-ascorbate metabolism protein UlaG (beta-lactamase superfamily)